MKAILISIQPQYVKDIIALDAYLKEYLKRVEMRKTKPNCTLPIDVYIYCSKGQPCVYLHYPIGKLPTDPYTDYLNGKVVAKFTLNNITEIPPCVEHNGLHYPLISRPELNDVVEKALLSHTELYLYGVKKIDGCYGENSKVVTLYGWHIENLQIFDRPMELREFTHCNDPYQYCQGCQHGIITYPEWVETADDLNYCRIDEACGNRLKRPPQSWQYVEVQNG
jgi:hypothetical protein